MAPTYMCRDPGIEHSDGHRGSAFLYLAASGFASLDQPTAQQPLPEARPVTSVMRDSAAAATKAELRHEALDPENRQRLHHFNLTHQDALEPVPLSAAEVSQREERTDA